MFYSAETNGFYTREINGDKMPADVVEISDELYVELLGGHSAGLRIVAGADGFPTLQEPHPATRDQVEARRLAAYAEPVTGSDRFFAEAARMNAVGEAGADAVTAAGVARYEAIKAENPWPEQSL